MRRLATAAYVILALATVTESLAQTKLPRARPLLRIDRIDASDPPVVNIYLTELDGQRQVKPMKKADAYRLSVNALPQKTRGKLETFVDRGEPLALVLVLQVSPALQPAFKQMVSGAEGLVGALPPGSQVGVVAYAEALVEHLKPTSPAKARKVLGRIAIREEALEVNLPFAVQEAIDNLKRANLPKRRVVVVVSDGLSADLKLRRFSQLARTARNRQIRVHTIGFATLEPAALRTLFELSGGRRADGTFRPTTSSAELSQAFESVRRELLKQRVLSYELPSFFKGEIADFQVESDGLASEPVEVELVAWKGSKDKSAWYASAWFITIVIALVLVGLTATGMLLWRRRAARSLLADGDETAPDIGEPTYEDEDEEGGAVAALVGSAPFGSAPAEASQPAATASPAPSTSSPDAGATEDFKEPTQPGTGPTPSWAVGSPTPTPGAAPSAAAPDQPPQTGPVPPWAQGGVARPAAGQTSRPMGGMLKSVGPGTQPSPFAPVAPIAPGTPGPMQPSLGAKAPAAEAPTPAGGGGMPLLPSPTEFLQRARDDDGPDDASGPIPQLFSPAAAAAAPPAPPDPLLSEPAAEPATPEPFGFGERKTQVMSTDEIESVDAVAWVVPLTTGTFETLKLRNGFSIGVERGDFRVAPKEGQPTGGVFRRDSSGAWVLDLAGVRVSAGQLRDNDRFAIGAVEFVFKEASRFGHQRRHGAAWLQVVGGMDDGRRVALAEGTPVTLGTHDSCDAVIRGEGVAPRHLLARLVGGACRIDDLGSDGGLRVGANPVGQTELQPGAEVGIGQLRLVFRLQAKGHAGA